jgi:hypothetical protein
MTKARLIVLLLGAWFTLALLLATDGTDRCHYRRVMDFAPPRALACELVRERFNLAEDPR